MERRSFLRWAIHGLSAAFAAILGIPALLFLSSDARKGGGRTGDFRDVGKKITDLAVLQSEEVVIRESRRDAWTLHPDDIIGRVILLRQAPRSGNEFDCSVVAFTTICPHLGCSINPTETGDGFRCPCHGAQFRLDGQRTQPRAGENPAPRNMDTLEVQLEPVNPSEPSGDKKILVKYQRFRTSLAEKIVE